LVFDIKGSRDIEKVEGHTINQHGEHKEPNTITGIADAKESETEDPGQHGNHHDPLDAEALHEEGDEKNTAGFTDLGEGYKDTGMLHTEGRGILGFTGKTANKGVGITVGNLKGYAQEHGENEENRHFSFLEKTECIQTQGLYQTALCLAIASGTGGKGRA
ncbi:hypothetical protein EVA_08347, partial [gut metagenome]